jgi:hypothetical protein
MDHGDQAGAGPRVAVDAVWLNDTDPEPRQDQKVKNYFDY